MYRRLILLVTLTALIVRLSAQQAQLDSLRHGAATTPNDTLRFVWLENLSRIFAELNPDSSYYYGEQARQLANKMNLKLDEAIVTREMGYALLNRGIYPRALQLLLSAKEIMNDQSVEKNVLSGRYPGDDPILNRQATPREQRFSALAFLYQNLGILYANAGNYEKSWHYHILGRNYAEQSGNLPVLSIVHLTLNRIYLQLNKSDSALISIQRAYDLVIESGYKKYFGSVLLNMGRTFFARGNILLAIQYYKESLMTSNEQGYFRGVIASSLLLADHYKKSGKLDSTFYYITNAFSAARNLDAPELLLRNYIALADYYKTTRNNDSVVKFQELIIRINDSLFNNKQTQQFQNIDFDYDQRQLEKEQSEKQFRARLQRNILLGSLGTFLLVALLLWRNVRQRKRSAAVLQKQNDELENTLENLKTTQKQLIQSEKMASLGEMTAGIAHEIQNPLNFVNNFSEVNKELAEELKSELSTGNMQSAKAIANDIKDNSEKINHHGKRAEGIVKSMLLHTRISAGQKEETDINALVDEYLRLAFHGLRAKDKSFNAVIKTEFDPGAGKIDVVAQDIGRVILNLINNAFYAVSEKAKTPQPLEEGGVYEPTVIVSTQAIELPAGETGVEIKVTDNGTGIQQKILDKIFQPFFTTKPAGKGTGLGLSISYDIIRAHGGELKAETEAGKGSVFTIILR